MLGGLFPPTARCARRPWVGATIPHLLAAAGARQGWGGWVMRDTVRQEPNSSLQGRNCGVSRIIHPPYPLQRTYPRHSGKNQSPSVSSEALPPAAVVFTVTVFSVAKRSR